MDGFGLPEPRHGLLQRISQSDMVLLGAACRARSPVTGVVASQRRRHSAVRLWQRLRDAAHPHRRVAARANTPITWADGIIMPSIHVLYAVPSLEFGGFVGL